MKKLVSTAAAFVAAASMSVAPVQAQENEYDPAIYEMMLDCAALQIIFAQNGKDDEESKQDSVKMGAAFLTSAKEMSGNDLSDLNSFIPQRIGKITSWITGDSARARKLTKTCAYVLKIGKNYVEG